MMQASRRSVKAHQSFGSIGSSLSTGLKNYLSKLWDPYVSQGCTTRLVFFCDLSPLFQHIDLVTTSLRGEFQVYLSQLWVLCTQPKAVLQHFLKVEYHFSFFLVNCLWRMESINVTGVLQEAGDTDSRAFTRSQV